ncbi:MAG: hypothetical protein PF447_07530 [Spirochaetaceae bacterium]|jgi:hypothetical protein|nr:hypothetical protein [Spirochaetaceae bacterium]
MAEENRVSMGPFNEVDVGDDLIDFNNMDDLEMEEVDFDDFGIDSSSFDENDEDDDPLHDEVFDDADFDEGEEVDLSVDIDGEIPDNGSSSSVDNLEEIDLSDFDVSKDNDLSFEDVDLNLDDD